MTLRTYLALISAIVFCSPLSIFARQHDITALAGDASEPAATLRDEKLAAEILTSVQKTGADAGIAFRTLDGKQEWFSRADDVFHAASTMKIPVMIELFHQVKQGKLKLEDAL